jgi:thioredoxin 1
MIKPLEIDEAKFNEAVLKAKNPVLVYFWAPRCVPCRIVAPIIDELASEYDAKVAFYKCNVDDNPKTASQFGVMSLPALMIFKNGRPFSNIIGHHPKTELKKNLETAL